MWPWLPYAARLMHRERGKPGLFNNYYSYFSLFPFSWIHSFASLVFHHPLGIVILSARASFLAGHSFSFHSTNSISGLGATSPDVQVSQVGYHPYFLILAPGSAVYWQISSREHCTQEPWASAQVKMAMNTVNDSTEKSPKDKK